jgi:hypothetical protein
LLIDVVGTKVGDFTCDLNPIAYIMADYEPEAYSKSGGGPKGGPGNKGGGYKGGPGNKGGGPKGGPGNGGKSKGKTGY